MSIINDWGIKEFKNIKNKLTYKLEANRADLMFKIDNMYSKNSYLLFRLLLFILGYYL